MWISPDPAGQFANPYSYGGDPLNYIDPTGMWAMGLGLGGGLQQVQRLERGRRRRGRGRRCRRERISELQPGRFEVVEHGGEPQDTNTDPGGLH